jgi:hypothetical protein
MHIFALATPPRRDGPPEPSPQNVRGAYFEGLDTETGLCEVYPNGVRSYFWSIKFSEVKIGLKS